MNSLLTKILNKRGIKDTTQLIAEEKETYKEWDRVLSEEPVTVDRIKQFCEAQIGKIEAQWENIDNTSLKNERLIIVHTVYSALSKLITSPQVERMRLEEYLNKLL